MCMLCFVLSAEGCDLKTFNSKELLLKILSSSNIWWLWRETLQLDLVWNYCQLLQHIDSWAQLVSFFCLMFKIKTKGILFSVLSCHLWFKYCHGKRVNIENHGTWLLHLMHELFCAAAVRRVMHQKLSWNHWRTEKEIRLSWCCGITSVWFPPK